MERPKRGRPVVSVPEQPTQPQAAPEAAAAPEALPSVSAPHLDPPRSVSVGESLKYNEGHRRQARDVTARTPRYPGPPEKRSLAVLIGDLTNNGAEIVELYLAAARGALPGVIPDPETGEVLPQYLEAKDRLTAAKWLGDRYYGKAPDVVQLETKVAPALSFDHLPLAERIELERLMARAIEGPVTIDAGAELILTPTPIGATDSACPD